MVICGKRGWLRIVEASIAILIIFGVLLVINTKQDFSQQPDLTRTIVPLLEEISKNITLREKIITQGSGAEPDIEGFLALRIRQSTIKYKAVVCESDQICSLPAYPQDTLEVYASERIISSTLQEFSPKKVKIFLWRSSA